MFSYQVICYIKDQFAFCTVKYPKVYHNCYQAKYNAKHWETLGLVKDLRFMDFKAEGSLRKGVPVLKALLIEGGTMTTMSTVG